MNFQEEIKILLKSKVECIWVNSYEEKYIISEIYDLIKSSFPTMKMFSWSFFEGLTTHSFSTSKTEVAPLSPDALFRNIIAAQKKGKMETLNGKSRAVDVSNEVYLLKDFHLLTDMKNIIRAIRDTKEKTPVEMLGYCPIIVVSPFISIPAEHEKLFHVINYEVPDEKRIDAIFSPYIDILNAVIAKTQDKSKAPVIDPEEIRKSKYYAKGLTVDEIKKILNISMTKNKTILSDAFYLARLDLIKKTGVLNLQECDLQLDDMGGNESFKEWIDDVKLTLDEEAMDFGVEKSKGFLALGVPGTAKTLSAEMIASELKMPLLKFDMSKVNEKIA